MNGYTFKLQPGDRVIVKGRGHQRFFVGTIISGDHVVRMDGRIDHWLGIQLDEGGYLHNLFVSDCDFKKDGLNNRLVIRKV